MSAQTEISATPTSTLAVSLCVLALVPKLLSLVATAHYKLTAERPRLVYKATAKNERLLDKCDHLVRKKFYPLWYLFNGHFQTLQLSWANEMDPMPAIAYERQLLDMPDGGVVSLDWALVSSEKETPLEQRIDRSKKTALNTPLRTPQLFCIAYTDDLRYVAQYLSDKYDFASQAFVGLGFSMGSNVLVKYLGEEGDQVKLTAAISVGNPFDMPKCSENIEGPLFNRLTYSRVLSAGLRDLFFNRSNAHEMFRDYPGIDIEALKTVKSVSEFDELFTIKHFNYKSVDEFYLDGSCVTRLPKVTVPLLCLNAEDDPISVATSLPSREVVEANPNVILCTTKSGGHLAFYEGDNGDEPPQNIKIKLRPWSAKVIGEFAESILQCK
ncbi:hypothetical protein BBO99_00001339 [Phytophthora kernoviae]|uniref:AB hydrolase-1 domain-containing protein n=2 Tax=Phytophthora kernoviae TaxID=325452 RepID=A0A3R7H1Z2_9STRA|nr:hypothetical protein G195_002326 [Phytophthora kernoviae 00238/432]KAG2529578.1 hypothetical protein JM16_001995 [Phytophthora kernoviae]KAG2530816.1 hypothetical protein JM18_001171 [Phytophthora kernoviae]RLN10261.1 hypothetical protein BBI17_001172 [Phytophthora kernoviae]RLN84404.1 hypothetical protein BBO99_00001339 [Phytophthora kernoviae]